MPLRAAEFEERHGEMARREHGHFTSAYTLAKALEGRRPRINVSQSALKVWLHQYAAPAGAIRVASTEELQRVCDADLVSLAEEHASVFRLQQALKARKPPVHAGDKVLRAWL